MEQKIALGQINGRYYVLTGGIPSKATKAFTDIDIYVSNDPDCINPQTEGKLYAHKVIVYYDDTDFLWKVLSIYDPIEKEVLEILKQKAKSLEEKKWHKLLTAK